METAGVFYAAVPFRSRCRSQSMPTLSSAISQQTSMPATADSIFTTETGRGVRLDSDVWMRIASYLSFMDLLSLSKVSSFHRQLAQQYFLSAFKQQLHYYVDDPEAFRNLLWDARAVIFGLPVVDFIFGIPNGVAAATLNVSVPAAFFEQFVGHFLRQGYKVWDREAKIENVAIPMNVGSPFWSDIIQMHRTSDGRRVSLILSTDVSSLAPVAYMWSTAASNYLGPNGFCLTYPATTLGRLRLENRLVRRNGQDARLQYRARGFTFMTFHHNRGSWMRRHFPQFCRKCDRNPYCPHRIRYFGDSGCLQFVFDPQRAAAALSTPIVPQFRIGGIGCGGQCDRLTSFQVGLFRVDAR